MTYQLQVGNELLTPDGRFCLVWYRREDLKVVARYGNQQGIILDQSEQREYRNRYLAHELARNTGASPEWTQAWMETS